ncbi:hypothetical protein SEUCBS139899_003915 [Sporothrix eucalyptigena]
MASNDTRTMPLATEEITLGWLQNIFQNKHISSFDITRTCLDETTSKISMVLGYDDEKDDDNQKKDARPKHILLKGGFNPAMLAAPGYKQFLIGAYTREVDFYTRFIGSQAMADKLNGGLQVPKVYWADASPEQAILAFEDLAAAGYVFGDPTNTYSIAAVHMGLDQLAALHAATWGWDVASPGSPNAWLEHNVYDATFRAVINMWDDTKAADDRAPMATIIRDNRERTLRAVEAYLTTRSPRFRCLLHGDAHSGNIYMDTFDGPSKLRFLDWQIVHIGSAFHDVAYFIIAMLPVTKRRTHELALIDYYLAALARHGGPTIFRGKDPEVMVEYRKSAITGVGWMVTPHTMQNKERVVAMVERYTAAMEDHRTIDILLGEKAT